MFLRAMFEVYRARKAGASLTLGSVAEKEEKGRGNLDALLLRRTLALCYDFQEASVAVDSCSFSRAVYRRVDL